MLAVLLVRLVRPAATAYFSTPLSRFVCLFVYLQSAGLPQSVSWKKTKSDRPFFSFKRENGRPFFIQNGNRSPADCVATVITFAQFCAASDFCGDQLLVSPVRSYLVRPLFRLSVCMPALVTPRGAARGRFVFIQMHSWWRCIVAIVIMIKTTPPFTTTDLALRCVMLQFAVPVCLSVCLSCVSVCYCLPFPPVSRSHSVDCLSDDCRLVHRVLARCNHMLVGLLAEKERESWLAVDHWIASHYYMLATTTLFPKKKGEKHNAEKAEQQCISKRQIFSFALLILTTKPSRKYVFLKTDGCYSKAQLYRFYLSRYSRGRILGKPLNFFDEKLSLSVWSENPLSTVSVTNWLPTSARSKSLREITVTSQYIKQAVFVVSKSLVLAACSTALCEHRTKRTGDKCNVIH